jgi:carboxyl-terminal processing protease
MRKLVCAVAAAAALGLLAPSARAADNAETYRQLNLFGDVFERIRADYVEETNDEQLIEAAINGMLRSLDPHSSYLNAKSFRDMQVQTRGEFGGLGIEVTMENGVVKVVSPIDETPADRAGLKAGDFITHLDGEAVLGLSLSEAVEKMRGPVNSKITLTVARPGIEQPFEVSLVRDVIRIQSVRSRLEDDIAYVRITSFNEQTEQGLRKAMETLRSELGKKQLRGVVLDLRNNPGGLLDQAISVSDAFLAQGEIVSTRGRDEAQIQRYNAREGDLADGKPVVVLINGGSASASEIVAGALQDHRRAVILGTKSFGKGSVQTIIPLQGHGAVRLTTARYFTPSGRSIQAKGIEPDIEVEQVTVAEADGRRPSRSEADLRGHLLGDDEQAEPTAPAVPTPAPGTAAPPPTEGQPAAEEAEKPKDFQLSYAFDLLRGITLLGERQRAN